MDELEFKNVSADLTSQINNLVDNLINTYQEKLNQNLTTLRNLYLSDPNFTLLNRDGSPVKTNLSVTNINVKDNIYIDLEDGSLSAIIYDPYIEMDMPQQITIEELRLLFKDVDFYKNIMHFVGLTGAQETSLEYQRSTLAALQDLNPINFE